MFDINALVAALNKIKDAILFKESLTVLIDNYTTADKIYIGKAIVGGSEGDLVWQIKCLDNTGNFLKTGYADGVSTFTSEWDERATYTYS